MSKDELMHRLSRFFSTYSDRWVIETALLYGSWAQGLPRADSDVDIAIVFADEPGDDEAFERLAEISTELESETRIETSPLAITRDFKKPMLYYNAVVQGIPLYVGNFSAYVRLRNTAIEQMEDFGIFGRRWQLEIAERKLGKLRKHA